MSWSTGSLAVAVVLMPEVSLYEDLPWNHGLHLKSCYSDLHQVWNRAMVWTLEWKGAVVPWGQGVGCSSSMAWGQWVKVPPLLWGDICRTTTECPYSWPTKAACWDPGAWCRVAVALPKQQQVKVTTWNWRLGLRAVAVRPQQWQIKSATWDSRVGLRAVAAPVT